MVSLYIENQLIELDKEVQFAITKTFEDISNPTSIINDWSKTVSIPFTDKNNETFGHIYNPDRITIHDEDLTTGLYFDPLKKLDFRLEWDSAVLMTGYAKMTSVTKTNGTGRYNITLNGELGKVFQEMKKITFDKSTEDTDYLIHGEEYVEEYINKELVYGSWTSSGQTQGKLYPKWYLPQGSSTPVSNPDYNVNDIIGFAPNNAMSEGFDYKSFQNSTNSSRIFTDALDAAGFKVATGIEPDTAIPNGLLPREIGEYRSYLQLPYIYWNKLFQLFQTKAEEVTGYQFELDSTWFNPYNPYWYNLVYMLKSFNTKKSEGATNYYNPRIYNATWISNTNTAVLERDVLIPNTTETFNLVEDFDTYPSKFVITNKDEVLINYSLGLELHNNGASNPYSLRLNKDNYLNIEVDILDSNNNNILKTEKYAVCDYECSYMNDINNNYKKENIFTYKELTMTGTYPNRLKYITINPTFTYILKAYHGLNYKFRISANWKSATYRFMTKYTESDDYVGTIPETVLKHSNNSLISAQLSFERRSDSYFTLNDLWNKDYNIFNEIIKYCKMFRIGISLDEYNKKIIFKQYSTYFTNYTVKDWTDKIDKSKDFDVKPITLENKYTLFNYKDSETDLGKKYHERYGFNYGEYRLMTDYNFNNNTTELFKDITQSITNTDNVLSWTNLYDYKTIIYSFPDEIFVYNKDKDKKQVSVFGAYYFRNGFSNFNTEENLRLRPVVLSDDTDFQQANNTYFYTQNASETISVSTYPALGIVNGDNLCIFNIPKENYTYLNNYFDKETIYSNFWENYLNERYNTNNKIVTCYLDISPTDYMNFEFNKFIKIENQLYFVNKIYDYDITYNSSTKVDLITIQDIEGYTTNNFTLDYFEVYNKFGEIWENEYDYITLGERMGNSTTIYISSNSDVTISFKEVESGSVEDLDINGVSALDILHGYYTTVNAGYKVPITFSVTAGSTDFRCIVTLTNKEGKSIDITVVNVQ